MRKYASVIIVSFCLCLVVCAGCAELAKVGKALEVGGKTGKDVSTYIPVYGQVLGAVSGIVSLVGAGLYRVASRRGTAIQTLVEAVKYSKEQGVPIKNAVRAISEVKGVKDYIDKFAQKYDPKPLIAGG